MNFLSKNIIQYRTGCALRIVPPSRISLWPNFIVIGAAKSGTSMIHEVLATHPEIFMSRIKEPNLFMADGARDILGRAFKRGRSDKQLLAACFRGYQGERIRGESSQAYTHAPFWGMEVPQRMRQINPAMKFLFVARHPVDRIESNYRMHLKILPERTPLDINTWLESNPHAIAISCYAFQLERYLAYFPRKQLHIMLFEEFLRQPQENFSKLFSFLGVADHAIPEPLPRINEGRPVQANFSLIAKNKKYLHSILKPDVVHFEKILGRKTPWKI
ncbi:sulfotransferase [Candidatus Woesearchaeota archaeon]|nr:sulfotransferase [Candidatus Woesearchaeota archaeon]